MPAKRPRKWLPGTSPAKPPPKIGRAVGTQKKRGVPDVVILAISKKPEGQLVILQGVVSGSPVQVKGALVIRPPCGKLAKTAPESRPKAKNIAKISRIRRIFFMIANYYEFMRISTKSSFTIIKYSKKGLFCQIF